MVRRRTAKRKERLRFLPKTERFDIRLGAMGLLNWLILQRYFRNISHVEVRAGYVVLGRTKRERKAK